MLQLTHRFPKFGEIRLNILDSSKSWVKCQKCEKLSNERKQVVLGTGSPRAQLLIIGGPPGNEEDQIGIGFTGRAGDLLNNFLEAVEIQRGEIFVEGILGCITKLNDTSRSLRPANKTEIENCLPRLHVTIREIDPLLIMTLGVEATQVLIEKKIKIGKVRGDIYIAKIPGIKTVLHYPVLPTYHPEYILQNPADDAKSRGLKVQCLNDFILAAKLLKLARKTYGLKRT